MKPMKPPPGEPDLAAMDAMMGDDMEMPPEEGLPDEKPAGDAGAVLSEIEAKLAQLRELLPMG